MTKKALGESCQKKMLLSILGGLGSAEDSTEDVD